MLERLRRTINVRVEKVRKSPREVGKFIGTHKGKFGVAMHSVAVIMVGALSAESPVASFSCIKLPARLAS